MIAGEGDAQHRRLLSARPGPHVMGEQIEPRLVYPDKTPFLVVGLFPRWPALLPPHANGRLVALRCPLDGSLHTVAQAYGGGD